MSHGAKKSKFISFLNSLKSEQTSYLIESFEKAYKICFLEADGEEGTAAASHDDVKEPAGAEGTAGVSHGDGKEPEIDVKETKDANISINGNTIHEEFDAKFALGDHIDRLDDIKKTMNKYGLDLNYNLKMVKSWIDKNEKHYYRYTLDVTYTAPEFKRDGYEYILTVQKTDAGNFVFPTVAHKDEDFSKYYSGTFICDHCHVDRLRNTYHIFRKEGKDSVYGTKCAREYFGIPFLEKINSAIMNLLAFLHGIGTEVGEDREEEFYGRRGKLPMDIGSLFAIAWTVFSDNRWSYIKGQTPRDVIAPLYPGTDRNNFYKRFYSGKSKEELEQMTETIEAEYAKFTDFWKNMTPKDSFEHNMKISVLSGDEKKAGLIVYAIYYWHTKGIKTEKPATPKEEKPESQHMGSVGEKITVDVEVKKVGSYESMYGDGHYLIFETTTGNTLVWYTTSPTILNELSAIKTEDVNWDGLEGMKIKIRGTVKEHKEYKGRKNTRIVRVKALGINQ